MTTPGMQDTQEFESPFARARHRPAPHTATVQVGVAGLSDPGKVRPNNEDHFLIVRFGRFLQALQSNLPAELVPSFFEDDGYAMAVADGMGGHVAGEEASRLALATLVNLVLNTPDWIVRPDEPAQAETVLRRTTDRFEQVNEVLTAEALENPQLQGFGTTMTLAASAGKKLFLTHIGDSRAYLFRRGKLHQLTQDHTLVRELMDAGVFTPAQAATHHLRHALTTSLGSDRTAKPDVHQLTIEDQDCLLLCSDGLNEMVACGQIAGILGEGGSSPTLCRRLVDQALAAGGKDNVTVVVTQYRIAEPSPR